MSPVSCATQRLNRMGLESGASGFTLPLGPDAPDSGTVRCAACWFYQQSAGLPVVCEARGVVWGLGGLQRGSSMKAAAKHTSLSCVGAAINVTLQNRCN